MFTDDFGPLFKVGQVSDLEGLVADSYIMSPHNSYVQSNEDYGISITFPHTGIVDEIESAFRVALAPYAGRPIKSMWKTDRYTARATSLLQPKTTTKLTDEISRGSFVKVRVRPEFVVMDECVLEVLKLVQVDNTNYTDMDDFSNGVDL